MWDSIYSRKHADRRDTRRRSAAETHDYAKGGSGHAAGTRTSERPDALPYHARRDA